MDSFYLFCTPPPKTDIGGLIFWIPELLIFQASMGNPSLKT